MAKEGWLYCQACGAFNTAEREVCVRCQHKLLVVSGKGTGDELPEFGEAAEDEGFSFDEHLLERISILEEAVKRTAETVRQLVDTLRKQERTIMVNHAGLATVRELLEQKNLVGSDEWRELWSSKVDYQLGALEKRQRFAQIRERALAFFRGRRPGRFRQLLEEAEQALLAFDVDRALEALEAAYRLDRRNYPLAHFIGETYFGEGDSERALEYFVHLLAAEPDHYEGLVYTGVIRHERGEIDQAIALLERAVEVYPDSFLPHFSLGALLAEQGKTERAVGHLERAVAIDSMPQALYFLGKSHYELGNLTRAVRHLEAAVRRDPSFDEAYLLLGLAYLDRRWKRKALEAFRQAQKLRPKRLQYHDLVRYLSGQDTSPLPVVQGKAGEWLARADELLRGRNPGRSLACYRRALALAPDNATVLMSYAVACLELDRSRETEAATRRVLDLGPGEMLRATAYATLMQALRTEGRFREGNRIGSHLLDEGGSTFARTIAYYEMACNLAEMEEDLDRALDYARRSLELAPEELKQFPLAALGWVHYKRKEFGEAVGFLSRSTELDPSANTLNHLGLALIAAGEEDRARKVLAEARRLGRRGVSLERKMLEFMRDSGRLLERVQQRHKK